MKISEFAARNKVTTKMLRHYDEIGLLKPSATDCNTGYRIYDEKQSEYLSWILILKNLDFSLSQIKEMLNGDVKYEKFVSELKLKRIEISLNLNDQIQKKLQIDKLIKFVEKEGFKMQTCINLLDFDKEGINELKKNMPNMEEFLENVESLLSLEGSGDYISVLRFDISYFKQVNDDYGFDVGDKVIVACYSIMRDVVSKYDRKTAIARLGGDEFAIFTLLDNDTINKIGEDIINEMKAYDFNELGCMKQKGCCIGIITDKKSDIKSVRKMLDDTVEAISKAREQRGVGEIFSIYSEII